MPGPKTPGEACLERFMRARMTAGLAQGADLTEPDGVPAGLAQATIRVLACEAMLAACSTADVLDCIAALPLGCLPLGDLCDMHTVVGYRALLKMMAFHPIVARTCGVDPDEVPDDPVVLAGRVTRGLAAMGAEDRQRCLSLFRDEYAEVMAAARQTAREAVALVLAQSPGRPDLSGKMMDMARTLS